MAGEIYQSYLSTAVLYALIFRPSDGFIWDTTGTPAFEAVGTWNDARVGDCDIPMTASGDFHIADFPSGITAAGTYVVQVRQRAGASPDTDDMIISQGFMEWDGSSEITLTVIDTNIDLLITNEGKIDNITDSKEPDLSQTKARIYI